MNLKCLICSDLFTPLADIYTTPCGHLFHYLCLTQWIERSQTCPQCRRKSTEKTIHKVFLSVEEDAEGVNDASTLQHKLDNIQFQLRLKEIDVKNATEKHQNVNQQNVGLREEIKVQYNKIRALESGIHALKEQVTHFKLKAKENTKMEEEIVRLREKLADMDRVQLVISGTTQQVNDMLRHDHNPQTLSLLISTLKNELVQSDRRRQEIKYILKEKQNESQNYKRELSQLTKQNLMLQQENEQHKHCETERQYLKKKIEQLQSAATELQAESSTSASNISIKRILTESPAPLLKHINMDSEGSKIDSPSVSEKVQEIKDSDSPYLRVQFSSVGLSGLMKYNNKTHTSQSSSGINKLSIFKQNRGTAVNDEEKPRSELTYDGLGGHSKYEEFPSPLAKAGTKRSKPMSAISMKFKKLAPPPQKKLKDYFADSSQE